LKPEEKENLQLAGEDAEKIAERPDKLIQLAVFHDLHCVVSDDSRYLQLVLRNVHHSE